MLYNKSLDQNAMQSPVYQLQKLTKQVTRLSAIKVNQSKSPVYQSQKLFDSDNFSS